MAKAKPIAALNERFSGNLDAYRSGKYKEAQLRNEFINPFFLALGWDVDNEQGYAEAYKDVVHEDSIKIGGATKAPDYCFRIGGARKFFVEAKKPSVDIKEDTHPAYQLRRYAWSAKLPLSIVTDFEEFAVYDCRIKPVQTDKASTARIKYYQYTDYIDKWEEIASIFSKDAVLKGSFDRYVESTRLKRGTAEVDDAFLAEIEQWRDELARSIALRNPKLSTRQLNFAVQKTIDRIIFLRICEDRGIEGYGKLQALMNGENVYRRLAQMFRDADDRYNSGLFHFKDEKGRPESPDSFTLNLTIDDDKLKRIVRDLYYPDSPYEFSVLGADILGQVYEQFLGKVIRLTAGHRAKVEEKPEVRKAGGVYYTPTYIVAYIVKNTVGKLCAGKTPAQVAKLRMLDPACGSGSFLLGAYQYLLDWHRDYYIADGPGKHKKKCYQITDNQWRLTTEERKRILLANIYGVDIDPQAVEVTKLSLLLKVLEGENAETLKRQLQIFHERALPDLGANIKCGNSLIGSDFYQGRQTGMFDTEEQYRINAFDWEVEFPEVFPSPQSSPKGRGSLPSPSGRRVGDEGGGFDAVIGNPPYLKEAGNKAIFDPLRNSKSASYCVGKMDLWYAFACKSIDLLKKGGVHSFIATNNWITNYGASILRRKIMTETNILKFVDFADFRVFEAASIQTMIYVLEKRSRSSPYKIDYLKIPQEIITKQPVIDFLNAQEAGAKQRWTKAVIDPKRGTAPFTLVDNQIYRVLEKLESPKITYISSSDIGNGIDVLQDFVSERHMSKIKHLDVQLGSGIFVIDSKEKTKVALTPSDKKKIKPYYTSIEISRYKAEEKNNYWLIYADKEVRENIDKYPGIKKHLDKFTPVLTSVFAPYGLHRPRDEKFFKGNRILSLRKTRQPQFSFVSFPCYVSRAFLVLDFSVWRESNLYILGLLNSNLVHFWLYYKGKKQGDQLQIDKGPLLQLPIRTIDFDDPQDKAKHDKMVKLVERMLELNTRLAEAKVPDTKKRLQRQIAAADREIDKLMYELYGLTAEEIKIVEGAG